MIIRTLSSIENTERVVCDPNGQWISHRLLLQEDSMGFSFNVTEIKQNCHAVMEYKNHLEACYCIRGEGEIIDQDGNSFSIKVGTIYALNKHDRHTLISKTGMTLVSIFNPALMGSEVHLSDGSYPRLCLSQIQNSISHENT